jgi:hypothetical protein
LIFIEERSWGVVACDYVRGQSMVVDHILNTWRGHFGLLMIMSGSVEKNAIIAGYIDEL